MFNFVRRVKRAGIGHDYCTASHLFSASFYYKKIVTVQINCLKLAACGPFAAPKANILWPQLG